MEMTDSGGWTPLHYAAGLGWESTVEFLLENGVEISHSHPYHGVLLIHLGSVAGHASIVRMLIKRGADVNYQTEDGCTPLCLACLEGHEAVVKVVIDHGVDVNSRCQKTGSLTIPEVSIPNRY